MPLKRWIKSTNYAIEGILHSAKTERHLRYHLCAAASVLLISYIIGVSRQDFLIIALIAIMVILAELLNTSIEAVTDLLSPDKSEKARIAKDVAAGAVLITALGAAIVGYIILIPYFKRWFHEGFFIARHSGEEVSIIALILVLILVVITKAYMGKGSPLRGGLPSGHAALSFSIWVIVTFTTGSFISSILCFVLASAVAASRVVQKIHTIWEVILGGLMGAIVTYILFRIFM
ncbi:MAG: diacylglycerol kinase [Thermodesulfovibrionales bacterium]